VRFALKRNAILFVLAAAVIAALSSACGFVAGLHAKKSAPSEVVRQYLRQGGNAPPATRAEVVSVLRAFQDGYVKRDPNNLDSFMSLLFVRDGDVLIQGTDGEWVRGYSQASQFIGGDWQSWGDFRFATDDSIVWSSGDVAWVATVGVLHLKGYDRPVRMSAVLRKEGANWHFQQITFQWGDRDADAKDLFHPRTYLQLARLAYGRLRTAVSGAH